MTEKVAVPETVPVFTVRHRFQPQRPFLRYRTADRLVLDDFQIGCADFAALAFGASLLDLLWPQQTADMIGAERWFGYHRLASVFSILLFITHKYRSRRNAMSDRC